MDKFSLSQNFCAALSSAGALVDRLLNDSGISDVLLRWFIRQEDTGSTCSERPAQPRFFMASKIAPVSSVELSPDPLP